MWNLGTRSQVLSLAWQVLYQLSHCHEPWRKESVDVNASHGHGIAHGVYHARTYLAAPSVYMLIAGDKNAGLVLLLCLTADGRSLSCRPLGDHSSS